MKKTEVRKKDTPWDVGFHYLENREDCASLEAECCIINFVPLSFGLALLALFRLTALCKLLAGGNDSTKKVTSPPPVWINEPFIPLHIFTRRAQNLEWRSDRTTDVPENYLQTEIHNYWSPMMSPRRSIMPVHHRQRRSGFNGHTLGLTDK